MDTMKFLHQGKPPTKPRPHLSQRGKAGIPKFLQGENPKTLWETYLILNQENCDAEEIGNGTKEKGPG